MLDTSIIPGADIQNYIDLVNSTGGGTINLANGTYNLTADLDVKSAVELRGEARDNVIIDGGGLYNVVMSGTDPYSTGTVTINFGDTTLVGSGTVWTENMVGQSVWLDNFWYLITAFTSETSIEIESYEGTNLAGANYVIATRNKTSILTTLTVQNCPIGVYSQYSDNPQLNDLTIWDCTTGIKLDHVLYPQMEVFDAYNGTNMDISYVEGLWAYFSDFSYSTSGDGIIGLNLTNSLITNANIFNNTGSGVYLTDSISNTIDIIGIRGNGATGITLFSGCNKNIVSKIELSDNTTYGLDIVDATSNNNLILGNTFSGNGTSAANDAGTGTLIRSNIGLADSV